MPQDAVEHDRRGDCRVGCSRTRRARASAHPRSRGQAISRKGGRKTRRQNGLPAPACGYEINDHQDPSSKENQVTEAAVAVERLGKTLGKNQVLRGISFHAQHGEIFGLLGPNGAGKTTTLRIICTLMSPDSGTVDVLGFDTRKAPEEVRRRIGVVTADIGVYPRLSARENIVYFARLSEVRETDLKGRVDAVIERLDIGSFADQRAESLSSGQKQKVAIARAIVHDPQVLMFDEPTSNLDVLASREVREFMVESKGRGKCVIFSTHVMHDAERLCDRITILHKGQVVASGATAEVRGDKRELEDAFLELVGAG